MLRMERGAARAAGRNARVIELEDLKRARERRASSARHPAEPARESRGGQRDLHRESAPARQTEDGRPFWEREDPFEETAQPFWQKERPFRGMEGDAAQVRPRKREAQRQARPEPAAAPRTAREQAGRADRQPERRPADRQGKSGLKALLTLLVLLAVTVLIGMKVFEIQRIDVTGAETVTPESIIALSGIARGENIFKVSLSQARQNLESDPLVEVLGISRVFPDRIKIDIRQRKPHGAIAWIGAYVIIDENGFALDVRETLPVGQFPLVTGLEIASAERGQPIQAVDTARLETMRKLLAAMRQARALPCVSEINLADPRKIMMLSAEGLSIDIGEPTELAAKAEWIACAVPELRKQGYTAGTLYVTGSKSPVYSAAQIPAQGHEGAVGDDTESAVDDGETGPGNSV